MDDPNAEDGRDGDAPDGERPFTETVELLGRYAQGEREALDRLFARYYQRVRVLVGLRLPQSYRSVIDVDDVVQRVFTSAFRNIERFDHRSDGAFLRWITTIAVNECNSVHDHLTAAKRGGGVQPHVESVFLAADGEGRAPEPADRGVLPPDVAAQNERHDLVLEGLRELSDAHREVIVLRDFLLLPFAEVARELGSPSEGAASMLHTRARVALGKVLRHKGAD